MEQLAKIAYHKSYRSELADNNNDKTKNAQLGRVLNAIFSSSSQHQIVNILKYTINCLTQQQNAASELPVELQSAIKFITANSNKRWFASPQNVTCGAVQILMAASYKLAPLIGVEIRPALQNRESKIALVTQVVDYLTNQDPLFPNLPRESVNRGDNALIQVSDKSYFDKNSIDAAGNFRVVGNGYSYVQPTVHLFEPPSPQKVERHSEVEVGEMVSKGITPQAQAEALEPEGFVVIDEEAFDAHAVNQMQNNDAKRKRTGRLSGFEISWLISHGLGQKNNFNQDVIIGSGASQVVIKQHVAGRHDINALLEEADTYTNPGLTLIPYGVTERGFLHEDHSVLIAIHQGKVYVIDPKSKADAQITAIPHKVISTNWQSWYDHSNCGRYTAYTAINLANQFMTNRTENLTEFDLLGAVNTLSAPNKNDLQQGYAAVLAQ